MKLRGPNGITVEQVDYTDRAGYRRRVVRLRQHGVYRGDYPPVEALAKVIDVGELVEDDPGQDAGQTFGDDGCMGS